MDTVSGISSSLSASAFDRLNKKEKKESLEDPGVRFGGTEDNRDLADGQIILPEVIRYLKRMELR